MDPQLGAPEHVDLAKAVQLALKNNPELSAARYDVSATEAQEDKTTAEFWPTVRGVVGWTEYRREQRLYPAAVPGEPAVISHHLLGGDLVATMPLFTGWRLSATREAAEQTHTSTKLSEDRIRAEIVYRVTALYYGILAQRRYCAALAGAEKALVDQQRRLRELVDERKAAPVDAQRAEVRLSVLRQRLIREENVLATLTLTLTAMLGRDGQQEPIEVIGTLAPSSCDSERDPGNAVADALKHRPDYLAVKASIEGQRSRVVAAEAGHWPQLMLQGSYGLRWGLWPTVDPAGVNNPADVGTLSLVADIPLFQGGRVSDEIREQEARMGAQLERARQLELKIRAEVQSSILDRNAAAERVSASETTVAAATEAYRVESEKYSAGRSTITDVLSTQADLLDAEAERSRALAESHTACAGLRLALGEEP